MARAQTINDLLTQLRGDLPSVLFRQAVSTTSGQVTSLWTQPGMPGSGSTPSTGAGGSRDSSSTGALIIPTLSSSQHLYINSCHAFSNVAGELWVCDRLVDTSGLSGTVATAQGTTTTSLPRYPNGDGVMMMLEVYSALGSTSRTVTATYTNQAGTGSRSTGAITIPSSFAATRCLILPWQAGDSGVRTFDTLTLSGTTGTAGNFGITLFKPLVKMVLGGTNGDNLDFTQTGLPDIATQGSSQPCLFAIFFANTTSSTCIIDGGITWARG